MDTTGTWTVFRSHVSDVELCIKQCQNTRDSFFHIGEKKTTLIVFFVPSSSQDVKLLLVTIQGKEIIYLCDSNSPGLVFLCQLH